MMSSIARGLLNIGLITVALALPAHGAVLNFTGNGPSGKFYEVGDPTNEVGSFAFNHDFYLGILESWEELAPAIAFSITLDFVPSGPTSIVAASFLNENDLVNTGDDIAWNASFAGLTAYFSAPAGAELQQGDFANVSIQFVTDVPGALMSGFWVLQDVGRTPVPEPATLTLLVIAVIGLALRRRKRA